MTQIAGMNPNDGTRLDGLACLRASVRNIITTPIGSLVMRRDYGSLVPMLIAQPLNSATLLRLYAATAIALARWEPRVRISNVRRALDASRPGTATLEIDMVTTSGETLSASVPIGAGA